MFPTLTSNFQRIAMQTRVSAVAVGCAGAPHCTAKIVRSQIRTSFFASDLSAIAFASAGGAGKTSPTQQQSRASDHSGGAGRGGRMGGSVRGHGSSSNSSGHTSRHGADRHQQRGRSMRGVNRSSYSVDDGANHNHNFGDDGGLHRHHQMQRHGGQAQRRRPVSTMTVAEDHQHGVDGDTADYSITTVGSSTAAAVSGASASDFISKSSFTSAKDAGRYGTMDEGSFASSSAAAKRLGGMGEDEADAAAFPHATAQMRESQREMRELFSKQPMIKLNVPGSSSNGKGQPAPEIPLLPVRYLKYYSHGRRQSYTDPNAEGEKKTGYVPPHLSSDLDLPLAAVASPLMTRAEERLHHIRQHNLLAQIGATEDELKGRVTATTQRAQIAKAMRDSPGAGGKAREERESQQRLPFRCLSCFHIFEALPSKLLSKVDVSGSGGGSDSSSSSTFGASAAMEAAKTEDLRRSVKFSSRKQLAVWKSMNTMEARRLEEQRNPTSCPMCRSRRVQWLMEYAHRSLHTSKVTRKK